jgi:hypothetical protein
MRCKNCHTVMMDTDPECPSCHASYASATAAPPETIETAGNGMFVATMLGGALGGMLYAAVGTPQTTVVPGRSRAGAGSASVSPSETSSLVWIFGVVFMGIGALVLMAAIVGFFDTYRIAQREPKVMTAADLCRLKTTESTPAWIAFNLAETKTTDLTVARKRLASSGEVQARCLLVRVGDKKWLAATVPLGFDDEVLVGRLVSNDATTTQYLIERAAKLLPKGAVLLPYEFHAVEGSSSDQHVRYAAAGMTGSLGLLALLFGVWLFRRGRPAPAVSAPAIRDWKFQPLPAAK